MPPPALATVDVAALLALIPADVVDLCRRLAERRKRGWVVGGCVRDLLLGRPVSDWDVATDARPEEVMRLFRRVLPTGIQHGTVTVLLGGVPYEVTTLRGDGAYADGRRPRTVAYLDDIEQDLARRDFTFNAIAIDPLAGRLIDPFAGQADLAARVVRAVGDPAARFGEDGLRVLRAARFAATLQCAIEGTTLAAMATPRARRTLAQVSAERVRDEWLKAMVAARPSIAFDHLQTTGLLDVHAPELRAMVGCEQNHWHALDVWDHTMACLDACEPDRILRVAALLHDVGKPATREVSDKTQDYSFYGHERRGAAMADRLLRRLRFSNAERARIVDIVRHHLVCYTPEWTDAAVRRWLRRVGPERIDDVCRLARADAQAKGRVDEASLRAIDQLHERVASIEAAGAALSRGDLAIDGHELMAALGLERGRQVGEILQELLELVTDDPGANERERLLAEARQIAQRRRGGGTDAD